MLKKTKVIIGVGASVLAGAGIIFAVSSGPTVEYETAVVDRGDVVEQVSVTGSIAPSAKVSLEPETSGKVEKIIAAEGGEVVVGDVLVELEAGDIEARVQAQRAAVSSALARLRELEAGATPEELLLKESAVDTAESRLAAAVAAKADADTGYVNADRNHENIVSKAEILLTSKIQASQLSFEDAAAAATDAISRLSSPLFTTDTQLSFTSTSSSAESEALHTRAMAKAAEARIVQTAASVDGDGVSAEQVFAASASISADLIIIKSHLQADIGVLDHSANLSASTLSTYQLNINTALNSVNSSLTSLSSDKSALELQQKLNDADITSAEIALSNASAAATSASFAVETAEKSLAQAQADLDLLKAGARKEVIAAQRAQVDLQQATLNGLLNELAKRRITAPVDGIVTLIAVEVGETVQPGKAAVVLNTIGAFEIIANVSEIDIAKVSVGDPVRITLDAFSRNDVWEGSVIAIQPAEKVVDNVIFYETKVRFEQEDERLRSGMTANLDIETSRKDGVLRVPVRAIRPRNGGAFVEVLESGSVREADVEVGLETDDHAEILSGLSEGQIVVVSTLEE